MSNESLLMVLGLLTAASPFLGLPSSWLMWMLIALGAAITFLGYAGKARRASPPSSIETPVAA